MEVEQRANFGIKGGAVLYSDFATLLRLALLQYITKLAMSKSQKPRSPSSKYIVMYPEDASVRSVKISPCTQNSVVRSLKEFTALLGSCEQKKYIFINSYLFALKPFKFTYMEKQLSST
jgi:hypothetical protein